MALKILTELSLDGADIHRIGGADMCELLGVSPAALTDFHQRGLAVKLGHDAYDLGATVTAYTAHLRGIAAARGGEDHVLALTTERARLAKEQADAQAMKNAVARGSLIDAGEVTREWAEVLRKVRASMLAVSSRLRASLPHLTAADAAAIDREIRDSLTDLAHGVD